MSCAAVLCASHKDTCGMVESSVCVHTAIVSLSQSCCWPCFGHTSGVAAMRGVSWVVVVMLKVLG